MILDGLLQLEYLAGALPILAATFNGGDACCIFGSTSALGGLVIMSSFGPKPRPPVDGPFQPTEVSPMKAVVYNGPRQVSVSNVPDARIEKPTQLMPWCA